MRHSTLANTPPLDVIAETKELPPITMGYLNRLRRVPVGAWVEAARALEPAADGPDAATARHVSAAHATLRRVVARVPGLAVQTQRRVQDLVEVAAGCCQAADTAMMRRAALAAALALAVRPAIGDDVFTSLYAPFDSLIPLSDLAGDDPAVGALVTAWDEVAGARRALTPAG